MSWRLASKLDLLMKPAFRKVLASLSVTLGVVLVFFELAGDRTKQTGSISWFWVSVGGGIIVLGMFELLSRKDPMIRP